MAEVASVLSWCLGVLHSKWGSLGPACVPCPALPCLGMKSAKWPWHPPSTLKGNKRTMASKARTLHPSQVPVRSASCPGWNAATRTQMHEVLCCSAHTWLTDGQTDRLWIVSSGSTATSTLIASSIGVFYTYTSTFRLSLVHILSLTHTHPPLCRVCIS